MEHATDLFSCHTPDGAYLYISPACHHLLGYAPDELLGHRPYELFHPDDQLALQHTLTPVLDQDHATTVTFRHHRKDDTYIWLETTSHPIYDPATGALVELHAISRDVRARKQVEQVLAESEARFRQMAEHIHEVFWLTDLHKQQMLYISPAYERIWGRTCESLYAAPESFVQASTRRIVSAFGPVWPSKGRGTTMRSTAPPAVVPICGDLDVIAFFNLLATHFIKFSR